jgi:hypothetical protein
MKTQPCPSDSSTKPVDHSMTERQGHDNVNKSKWFVSLLMCSYRSEQSTAEIIHVEHDNHPGWTFLMPFCLYVLRMVKPQWCVLAQRQSTAVELLLWLIFQFLP